MEERTKAVFGNVVRELRRRSPIAPFAFRPFLPSLFVVVVVIVVVTETNKPLLQSRVVL